MIDHIRHVRLSGAITSSSGFLVNTLLDSVDFGRARDIVELGPGTGCVTREILKRMHPDARVLSLEVNPVFVESLSTLGDRRLTLVQACASELPRALRERSWGNVDVVISGLPLSLMDDALVDQILNDAAEILDQAGVFVQYQYSLASYKLLRARYDSVGVTFELANVPPAFVYTCRNRNSRPQLPTPPLPSLGSFYGAALAAVGDLVQAFRRL